MTEKTDGEIKTPEGQADRAIETQESLQLPRQFFLPPLQALLNAVLQQNMTGHIGRVRPARERLYATYSILVQVVVEKSWIERHPLKNEVLKLMLFGSTGPAT